MMNKKIYLSGLGLLILASCKTLNYDQYSLNVADKPMLTAPAYFGAKTAKLKEEDKKRWSHLDLVRDSVPGMSVDRAYAELIKGKEGKSIVVGVIDSGVDVYHEDLKYAIWNNPTEIAGNNKDDDDNGLVDDIRGWNYLGDTNEENMEFVRVLRNGDDGSDQYKRAVEEMEKKKKANAPLVNMLNVYTSMYKALVTETGKKNFTQEDLDKISPNSTDDINSAKDVFGKIFSSGRDLSYLKSLRKHVETQTKYYLNLDFNGRKVSDNLADLDDKNYGDGNVYGNPEHALHGTHVAGIIAQKRGNDMGGDGVINQGVKIMSLRAVPDGDEYDKDIALSIRYAVDNGAKVINGSFGKYFETNKEWVYDAIKYANEKDVLIVVAAGNDALDINGKDVVYKYPNDINDETKELVAPNFLVVGALNPEYGKGMVANFSNFGHSDVDVFAPGVQIYATTPESKYKYLKGTSMASPNVAGVAAVVRSYYPSLTAAEVKKVIMDSGIAINNEVIVSGKEDDVRNFKNISTSGKIVNLYNALILADKIVNKK